jgi:hypothetical protein
MACRGREKRRARNKTESIVSVFTLLCGQYQTLISNIKDVDYERFQTSFYTRIYGGLCMYFFHIGISVMQNITLYF